MDIRRPPRRVLLSAATAMCAALTVAGCDREERPPSPAPAPVPHAAEPAPAPGARVFPLSMAPALDDPGRDRWQRPDDVVAALSIRPGERIADVGCGTGYFTMRLLRATGRAGHVVAVDVQQGMLDLLERRLGAEERKRVTLRRSAPARPLEAADAVDLVLCANTLYEVDEADAAGFVRSMADGLAPGGRLAILDWRPVPMQLGPHAGIRISPDRIRDLARRAGLSPSQDLEFLPTHTFLIFTKPK